MAFKKLKHEIGKELLRHSSELAPLSKVPAVGRFVHKEFFGSKNKGRIIPIDKSVDNIEDVVLPSDIVRHLVRKSGRRVIMNKCICRTAGECTSYPEELGCIFMGEASKKISSSLCRPVSVDVALEHIDKCQEAGLVHLVGRFKFDAMVLDARPHDKLVSICNCCECCCIFNNIPDLYKPIGNTLTKLEGVELEVSDACKGCGMCEKYCFVDAIKVVEGKAEISDECRGCGRCATKCPTGAITLSINNNDILESTIRQFEEAIR